MDITYDLECVLRFDRDVASDQQVTFKRAATGGHAGWTGPTPVVNWKGPREAQVLLVLHGPPPDVTAATETVVPAAEAQVRGWTEAAGLTPESGASPQDIQLEWRANPRIAS